MIQNKNLHKISGACHEAGHAVVARRLGLLIKEAQYTFGKNGASSGHVRYLPCAIFEAYPLIAGHIAQLMAVGKKRSTHLALCASSDYQHLQDLLRPYLTRDQSRAYEYKLEDDVAGFLNQPDVWKCVSRFGEELALYGRLTSNQCMRLTDEVPRAELEDVRQTMLSPLLHNHFGRRIGRAERVQYETLLREAVIRLHPAFQITPPFADIRRLLVEERYTKSRIEQIVCDVYSFWLKPTT